MILTAADAIAALVEIIADGIVAEYQAELAAENAAASNDESNTSGRPLARTGTDGE